MLQDNGVSNLMRAYRISPMFTLVSISPSLSLSPHLPISLPLSLHIFLPLGASPKGEGSLAAGVKDKGFGAKKGGNGVFWGGEGRNKGVLRGRRSEVVENKGNREIGGNVERKWWILLRKKRESAIFSILGFLWVEQEIEEVARLGWDGYCYRGNRVSSLFWIVAIQPAIVRH